LFDRVLVATHLVCFVTEWNVSASDLTSSPDGGSARQVVTQWRDTTGTLI